MYGLDIIKQLFRAKEDYIFKTFKVQKMTDKDLGEMYLVYNTALIVRSSSDLLFFKI